DAERSPRSGEEPSEIEAGDVLHDASAAADRRAAPAHEFDAEREIARRAETRGERTGGCGGDRRAGRAVVRAERIQREPLAVRRNGVVNLAQRRASFGGEREIAGRVLGDAGVRGE